MIDIDEHDAVAVSSERSFGLVFAVVFLIFGLWPLISNNSPHWPLLVISVGFGITALFLPKTLKPLNILWFKFGLLLGKVVGPIVMGLIFFLAVTPTALIFKLRRKDLLNLNRNDSSKSYWIPRDETTSGSMRDQF